MDVFTNCPQCQSNSIYFDGNLWICPECFYEWTESEIGKQKIDPSQETMSGPASIFDAHGNVLADGDTVIVIKDLKIRGSSSVVKGGTKVKNIRLYDAGDGHNISCKIEGFGSMNLKSEYVKKVE